LAEEEGSTSRLDDKLAGFVAVVRASGGDTKCGSSVLWLVRLVGEGNFASRLDHGPGDLMECKAVEVRGGSNYRRT
jgi:hypothetical protein